MEYVELFVDFCTNFISEGGLLFGFFLILLESFLPVLPLGVFVALNVNAFGGVIGIFISWMATCLGCFISYTIFSFLSSKFLHRLLSAKTKKKVDKAIVKFQHISFSNLVLIIALPFTPAFLINIVCGIARVSKKKFIVAILTGKIFMLIFWGYVGKSLIESMTDINSIIVVSLLLVVAYFVSKVVSKKANLD